MKSAEKNPGQPSHSKLSLPLTLYQSRRTSHDSSVTPYQSRLIGWALACFVATGFGMACAQTYPTKPIHWIVPCAPGGPTDIMSRAVGEKLVQQWGQQLVVDNRGGAGGNIGAELVARAAPDGYTVMIGHVGTHAINAALY